MLQEHKPQSEYQIPTQYETVNKFLADQLAHLKDDIIEGHGGHPVSEIEAGNTARHAQIIHIGTQIATIRQEVRREAA